VSMASHWNRTSSRACVPAPARPASPVLRSCCSFATNDEMMTVLDVIQSEGVELTRVVMGHTGGKELEYMKRLFQRGVFVEWDYMGQAPLPPAADAQRIESIAAIINAGYADHVLLAHDVCTKAQLKKNGGGGYTYISNVILPGLKAKGISDETLRRIMVDNPLRALTFVAPQATVEAPPKP